MELQSLTFQDLHVLVIGDAMIDRYYNGIIERQSPEADVPIVRLQEREDRLGGAANVALNVKKLGAEASLISITGRDTESDLLQSLLKEEGIDGMIIQDTSRSTTVKSRLYNQQEYLLRIDKEYTHNVDETVTASILKAVGAIVASNKPDVVILQDYNKGLFTDQVITELISFLKDHNIKITVDPKKDNFFAFQGVDLFKPNLKEVKDALALPISPTNHNELINACTVLQERTKCKSLLMTLSEHGALGFGDGSMYMYDAYERNVVDVSGAGDTVIALASLLLTLNVSLEDITWYCNLAGGLVIEKKGVECLSWEEIILAAKQVE